jgi:hypothetical protein
MSPSIPAMKAKKPSIEKKSAMNPSFRDDSQQILQSLL